MQTFKVDLNWLFSALLLQRNVRTWLMQLTAEQNLRQSRCMHAQNSERVSRHRLRTYGKHM